MKTTSKRTQIICTIGPACRSPEKIAALIKAGMDIARLHFSYAGQEEHAENISRIRAVARRLHRPVKILQDLTGAKVRMGEFTRGSVQLKSGSEFTLTARTVPGNARIVSLKIPELISVIRPRDTILLNDGELHLQALSVTSTDARCRVLVGGRIKSGQSVRVPGKAAPVCLPTLKDFDDVAFGLAHQVDFIALSFVTTAAEVNTLRKFIRDQGARTPIIAKIERREAFANLNEIIRAADLVMVARGDLGQEIPLEEIGIAQKKIIRCANRLGKPAITATEMLLSMMEKPHPTRAEVTDATNAILDGSSAVMLSGETAMGKFPIEATQTLAKIAALTDATKK
jgi:pyruvate kinase